MTRRRRPPGPAPPGARSPVRESRVGRTRSPSAAGAAALVPSGFTAGGGCATAALDALGTAAEAAWAGADAACAVGAGVATAVAAARSVGALGAAGGTAGGDVVEARGAAAGGG